MTDDRDSLRRFLESTHPFDTLPAERREALLPVMRAVDLGPGEAAYRVGERVAGIYAVAEGAVEIRAETGDTVLELRPGETFGARALAGGGTAPVDAVAREASRLWLLPEARYRALLREEEGVARFFRAQQPAQARAAPGDLSMLSIAGLMTPDPISVAPGDSAAEAARVLGGRGISCVLVSEGGRLVGLLTTSDLCARVLAAGLGPDTQVREVMTPDPVALAPDAIGLDAVIRMTERGIGHLPVVEDGRAVGIVTRTNLLLRQALSAPALLSEIAGGRDTDALAATVAKVPDFLAQLVGSGAEHQVVTRLVTDVTDALTRRLLALAEAELGPPPVPYLWAACGSQGRQEQTGVSDQDNCLILDDAATAGHDPYFERLARRVCDGLAACGFFHCPGGMMATNPRWRQPVSAWRGYFDGWIETPDPEARMLASVMFDLRPIAGESSLFEGLQSETLRKARRNSIFIAHMVANSLTHQPPLGLFRGFALIRSGEHKDSVDLKLNGVVPVVDLARLYALMGGLSAVNTRARLVAAREAGLVSDSGGAELVDAYDLIAETRLRHQAAQVRAGERPDNFMIPATLSELERGHLRNAFMVVKTMQSAVAQGRHTVV
jgi:CBS domain-containing protein